MKSEIEKPKFYCYKILPLVYDDSLSYYESICKFQAKLNEVIDALEGISLEVLGEAKAYTDSEIAKQNQKIDTVVAEMEYLVGQTREELNALIEQTTVRFDGKINELQNQYSDFTKNVNALLTLFNNKLDSLDNKLDEEIIGVNARTDLAIQQNNDYIFDVISENLPSELKVVNLFTGEKISVQDMFNYLASLHITDGITYNVLGEREISVNDYVGLNMTYTDLVTHGNSLIPQ